MKKFDMSLDKTNKELKVKVWGMYVSNDANSFVTDFTKIASAIQTSEFILHFDTAELKLSTRKETLEVKECFEIWKDFNFKKVILII
jgi:hypothetical protein